MDHNTLSAMDHQQFSEMWRLLGERLFVLKSITLAHPRGLAECFITERERSGSRQTELSTLEEIRQIGEAVLIVAELVQSADELMRNCFAWCDEAQAERAQEARASLQQAAPAGSA